MPLAWSGCGRGDYRETPLDIGKAADLRYESHRILTEPVQMTSGLPQASGEAETLEITLTQAGLEAKLYFSVFGGVLTRRTVLCNTGNETVSVHKCMSFQMDLPGD